MQRTPLTRQGAEKLRAELEHLKKIERPRIIEAISEARAHGDLKENAEYHAAKEQQSFLEGRIHEIEHKIANAQIVDVTQFANDGKVIFGATVTLMNVDSDEQVTYQIVGEDEADLKHQKISVTSPIARAIVGKMLDDEVTVLTPQGETVYCITQVDYI